jgi:uncharacterized membrane protein
MNLPKSSRLEAFSDGVFAIITTLLILEIHVPNLSDLSVIAVLTSLKPLIPKFISFSISFFTIAIFWINHHHFFNHIRYINMKLLWLNVLFLFWMCILPFTTAFIGDYSNSDIIVAIYSLNMTLCGASFTVMAWYAFLLADLSTQLLSRGQMKREIIKGVLGSTVYFLTLIIAFIWRPLALVLLFLLPFLFVVPSFFGRSDPEA